MTSPKSTDPITIPAAEWGKQGEILFGSDRKAWRFTCPSCGLEQGAEDFEALGIKGEDEMHALLGYTCVGYFRRGLLGALNVVGPGERSQGAGCTYEGGVDGDVRMPLFVKAGETTKGVPVGSLVFNFAQPKGGNAP